jgi:MFS family permease
MDNSGKITGRIWAGLVLLGFAGQLAWAVENQFYNTFVFDKITPDPKAISWMVAASAIIATLTTIFMGSFSDRLRTRWGRRKPLILSGYLLWGLFTALFPTAAFFKPVAMAVFMAIFIDCVMTFFGSTANDASLNAYLTDVTTAENRGRATGVLELVKWAAILLVYGGAGLIIQAFGYFAFFYVIGGIVLIFGLIGSFCIEEPDVRESPPVSYWAQIAGTFSHKSLTENREFFLVLIAVSLWGIAQNIFFPFLLIYLQHYIKVSTMESSVMVAVAIFVGGILMAYPLGLLADKWGRKKVAYVAIILELIGLILFSFAHSLVALMITGILWLTPTAAWDIATGAWSKDLFPEDKRGQFAGYFLIFMVMIPMILGPVTGGWFASEFGIPVVIDGKPGMVPGPQIFQVAGIVSLLAYLPLLAVGRKDVSGSD